MSEKKFKLNEREIKLLMHLLSRLGKRIYLVRVSLYGKTEIYFPNDVLVTSEIIEKGNDYFKTTYDLSADEYKLMVDSCEIETCIRRISYEMKNFKTFQSLKDVVMEFENEGISFKKHQKMIEVKKKQIEQLNDVLSQGQSQVNLHSLNTEDIKEKIGDKIETFSEVEFLKKLMYHKVESNKNYFNFRQAELEEKIECFQRETRMQTHADIQTVSFWLLKYDSCSETMDVMIKKIFDNWAKKRRDYAILKKFRKLNLERIEKLRKLILERDIYIEKYRAKKEKELKERIAELKRQNAATMIQAYWRGTMVRKHLGPYKIKKPKKKGKKGKGAKKKGKK